MEIKVLGTGCAKCKKLVVVSRTAVKAGCPECRGRLRKEEKQTVACPSCTKPLRFENDGLWD